MKTPKAPTGIAGLDEITGGGLPRGRTTLLVGGSGLYVQAVLDDLVFPGTDDRIRTQLEQELAIFGAETLHGRLAQLDPAAALAILPSNGRRVVRALEVIELTGRPFSASLPRPGASPAVPSVQLGPAPRAKKLLRFAQGGFGLDDGLGFCPGRQQ